MALRASTVPLPGRRVTTAGRAPGSTNPLRSRVV